MGIAELLQRHRHGLVDDLHQPAANQLLVFHEGDVRFDARRIAIHHEADRACRREDGRLRVAIADLLAELHGIIATVLCRTVQIRRHVPRVDVADRVAVLAHDAKERLAVLFEA